jgi:hypothetical protein
MRGPCPMLQELSTVFGSAPVMTSDTSQSQHLLFTNQHNLALYSNLLTEHLGNYLVWVPDEVEFSLQKIC